MLEYVINQECMVRRPLLIYINYLSGKSFFGVLHIKCPRTWSLKLKIEVSLKQYDSKET